MRLNKIDINWNKLFIVLYIIVAIIIIFIIWKPESKNKINVYEKLKVEEVDKLASEEYINKFVNSIYENNVEFLYDRLLGSYISYNELDFKKFNSMFNNSFNSNNLSVSDVEKITYDDKVIYRTILKIGNENRRINIIEIAGKKWNYTLDNFYNFRVTNYSDTYKDIKFTIDSVYQDFDYIEFTCYIENFTTNNIDIHMEQENSILIKLDTNEVVYLSNAQIDQNISKINSNTFSSRTFKFNIDLENQSKITQIIFNNIEINGESEDLIINLYF